jgi:hypothetical protein
MILRGILDYAKARGQDIVGFTTDDGRLWYINVREGMDDVVRSYFDQRVSVTGDYDSKQRKVFLREIEPIED